MSRPGELLEQLPTPSAINAARSRIELLEAVEAWALTQLPIAAGDHVRLTSMGPILDNAPGWRSYREALADDAAAVVTAVRYTTHRDWVAHVVLDHEWSVSDSTAYGPWWNGPGEPPDGYQDGRRGEDDRRHTWTLPLANLRRVTAAPQSVGKP